MCAIVLVILYVSESKSLSQDDKFYHLGDILCCHWWGDRLKISSPPIPPTTGTLVIESIVVFWN